MENLFVLFHYIPFLGLSSTKQRITCLAKGHNAVPLVRFEYATPQSRVKHSTTEPLHSSEHPLITCFTLFYNIVYNSPARTELNQTSMLAR